MGRQRKSLENEVKNMLLSIDILNHNEEVFKKLFLNPQKTHKEEPLDADNKTNPSDERVIIPSKS